MSLYALSLCRVMELCDLGQDSGIATLPEEIRAMIALLQTPFRKDVLREIISSLPFLCYYIKKHCPSPAPIFEGKSPGIIKFVLIPESEQFFAWTPTDLLAIFHAIKKVWNRCFESRECFYTFAFYIHKHYDVPEFLANLSPFLETFSQRQIYTLFFDLFERPGYGPKRCRIIYELLKRYGLRLSFLYSYLYAYDSLSMHFNRLKEDIGFSSLDKDTLPEEEYALLKQIWDYPEMYPYKQLSSKRFQILGLLEALYNYVQREYQVSIGQLTIDKGDWVPWEYI